MASIWENTDTGELFNTFEDALQDARENYDYGDPTNAATWADMPYVEYDEDWFDKQLDAWTKAFERSAA